MHCAFDGRITLYPGAETGVVDIGEPQMGNTHLGCDIRIILREQIQLLGRGKVHHMQTRTVFRGQSDGVRGGLVTGQHVSNLRMPQYLRVTAGIQFFYGLHVGADNGLVFTVRGDKHRQLEDFRKRVFPVHQHSSGGRAHEEFHTGHTAVVHRTEDIDIVPRGTDPKAVIGHRILLCAAELVLERLQAHRSRIGVRHLHERGDPPGHGRTTFRGYGGLGAHLPAHGNARVSLSHRA